MSIPPVGIANASGSRSSLVWPASGAHGHQNVPHSTRLDMSHMPAPSRQSTLRKRRRLLVNTNNAPLRVSSLSVSDQRVQPVDARAHVARLGDQYPASCQGSSAWLSEGRYELHRKRHLRRVGNEQLGTTGARAHRAPAGSALFRVPEHWQTWSPPPTSTTAPWHCPAPWAPLGHTHRARVAGPAPNKQRSGS